MSLALRNAAPLKPDILLAQALSEFEAVLTNDQKTQLRVYRGQRPPEADDVMQLTAEIDKQNSRRRSRRCVGPRLTNILQSVQQFSATVDTIVGGSQSLLASAVWGVLKVTLHITSAVSSYFENLSRLFMNIGRSCPRYQDFASLYPRSTRLQASFCEYFTTIVNLCKHAVLFIRKPFLSQLSSSVLVSFDSEFGPFEKDLSRCANTIREEASLASKQEQSLEIKMGTTFRKAMLRHSARASGEIQEARKLKSQRNRARFLDACSTYDNQTAWKQARKAGTTTWLYDTEQYKRWTEETSPRVLCCTGILGSGKTVLSANIVENITTTVPAAVVAYFFCMFDEAESLKSRTIIGSIARQLLYHVKPEVFNIVDTRDLSSLNIDRILEYLERLLQSEHLAYFVMIDGLDDCSENESKLLIQHVSTLLTSKIGIHLYCSSRPDVYQRLLASLQPQDHVSMSETRSEISQYIKSELEQRLGSGDLCLGDPALILTIHDALVKGSQGMFLWVAFQLNSICSKATDEDIVNRLQSLPKDLPETFNRILRKLAMTKSINPGLCKRIFELVAAAQRPLTLDELREALSIIPGKTEWDVKRLINDMHKALNSCGSLLVCDEEDLTAHFAHHSVKQHLLSKLLDPSVKDYYIDQTKADANLESSQKFETVPKMRMSDIPSAVLRQSLFRSRIASNMALKLLKDRETKSYDGLLKSPKKGDDDSKVWRKADQGYAFLRYARKYWLLHSKRLEPTSHASFRLLKSLVIEDDDEVILPWKEMDGATGVASWRSGLHWAISASDEGLVRVLLQLSCIDVNARDQYGWRPLPRAVFVRSEAIVKLLLERYNVDINQKDEDGRTPLIRAIREKSETIVKGLLERDDIDVNLEDKEGWTPLTIAASLRNEGIVRLLLGRDDIEIDLKGRRGRTALSIATAEKQDAVVQLLQAHKSCK